MSHNSTQGLSTASASSMGYETAPSSINFPRKSGSHDYLPASDSNHNDLSSYWQFMSQESMKLPGSPPIWSRSHSSPHFRNPPHSAADSSSLRCPSPLSALPPSLPSHSLRSWVSFPCPTSFIHQSLIDGPKASLLQKPDLQKILGDDASDKVLAAYHEMVSEIGELAGVEPTVCLS